MRMFLLWRRTVLIALCCFILLLASAALGEVSTATPSVLAVETIIGENRVRYPQLQGMGNEIEQSINNAIVERGKIAQRMVTLATLQPGGTGLQVDFEAFLEGDVFSAVINARGVMENGRNGQAYVALCYHLSTGEPLTLDDFFTDPELAVSYMEETLEETYPDELGSYVENGALTPLPRDSFSIDSDGITFYYDQDQFSLVTGTSGAAHFYFDELNDYLLSENDALPVTLALRSVPLRDEQIKAAIAYKVSLGELPHIRAKLGDPMQALIDEYRLLREPDQYPGGRYCQLEAPMFRQILILTDALAKGFENSKVLGLLSYRCNLFGIQTGSTTQERWREILGTPESTVDFDEMLAYTYGLPVGTADYYTFESSQLFLYADEDSLLYAVRLTQT